MQWFGRLEELRSLDLSKARLYDGSRWLPRSVGAITLSLPLFSWWFGSTRIYFNVRRSNGNPSTLPGIELLAEELYHAKQQLERGAASFYCAYLWEYFQLRRRGANQFAAYNAISFEREAKAFARKAALYAADSHAVVERDAAYGAAASLG